MTKIDPQTSPAYHNNGQCAYCGHENDFELHFNRCRGCNTIWIKRGMRIQHMAFPSNYEFVDMPNVWKVSLPHEES